MYGSEDYASAETTARFALLITIAVLIGATCGVLFAVWQPELYGRILMILPNRRTQTIK